MSATRLDVQTLIEDRVKEIIHGSEDVVLAAEAGRLVTRLREEDPDALIDWFEKHALTLIRQQLQTRLAMMRRGPRVSVFDEYEARPFERRYAVEHNVWRPIGEMVRPDWRYLIENRSALAKANLFDVALARRVIEKLPDDATPTREVLSEPELLELEEQATYSAEAAVNAFSR